MSKESIIFDMDYTLSIPKHREHLLPYKMSDYDSYPLCKKISLWKDYFLDCISDPPVESMVELAKILNEKYNIIVVSARDESARKNTEQWLINHGIEFHSVHLRQIGDVRPAKEIKLEIIKNIEKNFSIKLIFDDDIRNADYLKEHGYLVIRPL